MNWGGGKQAISLQLVPRPVRSRYYGHLGKKYVRRAGLRSGREEEKRFELYKRS